MTTIKQGDIVNYINGNLGVYEAKVIRVEDTRLLVSDTDSVLNIQNYIDFEQIAKQSN